MDDFFDHVKPAAHKKPGMLVIYTGTNDYGDNLNIRKKENDVKIAFSDTFIEENRKCKEIIDDSNKKLKMYCTAPI